MKKRFLWQRVNWWQRIKGLIFRRQYKLLGAVDLLCEVHTRDGTYGAYDWSVQMGASPEPFIPNDMYVDAWRTLRRAVKRPTE
jgi:hypothetical protein